MLVLTRKAKQRIQIGRDVSITVLRVKGNTVRIGIDAPADVRVRRSELHAFDAEQESELAENSDLPQHRPIGDDSSAPNERRSRSGWSTSDRCRGKQGDSAGSGSSRHPQPVVRSSHDGRMGVVLGR